MAQVDDLDAFVGEVVAQYPPGTPIFQGAQSMGSLMTLHSVLRDQSRLRGLVLCSALVNVMYTPILRRAAVHPDPDPDSDPDRDPDRHPDPDPDPRTCT